MKLNKEFKKLRNKLGISLKDTIYLFERFHGDSERAMEYLKELRKKGVKEIIPKNKENDKTIKYLKEIRKREINTIPEGIKGNKKYLSPPPLKKKKQEETKKCPYCLEKIKEEEIMCKNCRISLEKRKKYFLYNKEINIDERLLIYNEIRKEFKMFASDTADNFNSDFFSIFSNLDELISNLYSTFFKYIGPIVEYSLNYLITKGIYDLNEEFFLKKYLSKYLYFWDNVISELKSDYEKIIFELDNTIAYREQRKNNRDKWGVGFVNSYEDAIEAKLKAGSWNLVEGIGHSIFNSIKNNTTKETSRNKNEFIIL